MKRPPVLVLPALGWFLWFLLVPLVIVGIYSFSTKGTYGGVVHRFTLENYLRATDWLYLKILWNSVKLALLTATSCLVIGYPMAYVMATSSKKVRSILMVLVVIPFWTNFVVRAYATKVLFGEYGPINQLALSLGLIHESIPFENSSISVWMGMVTNYLPFMVLPLFVALEKFDFSLLEAAKDLGASSWKTVWRVLFPLTRPGIVTGLIFVFTPALGEFVIPDLLGGARTLLIGNLVTEQFLKTRDWPFGAALSLLLILVVMVCLVIFLRSERAREKAEEGATNGI
ncbi:MAG: ABC transporter permease [Bdellovibrio sp.]|nr:ABC transporter permease [Bdellovibrio sp.]